MFEGFKALVLRWMRVPPEPEPPLGAPGSVRVFRAAINQYRLRVLRWFFAQSGAIVGIGFSLAFLGAFESGVEEARRRAAEPPTPELAVASQKTSDFPQTAASAQTAPSPVTAEAKSRAERRRERERVVRAFFVRNLPRVMPLIYVLEVGGIAIFLVQLLLTYAIVRLEFEQHWYIVTDRSLRIRTGILRLQESTMSFANVQQVEIRQGPLQRVLGLANVCVRSAGGGEPAPGAKGHGQEATLHTGIFEGVSNAVEIRDLILDRLRRFREAGLGDPEDRRSAASPDPEASGAKAAASAAEELLREARALRRVLATQ